MTGLDTAVLIAHELAEAPNHRRVRQSVAEAAKRGRARFALAPQVVHEFLHVATDPRRFETPLEFAAALQRAEFWWNAAEITRCLPDDRAMGTFLDWMGRHRLGRKRILDTALAATYFAAGVREIATANPDDFNVFGAFSFAPWAILAPGGSEQH